MVSDFSVRVDARNNDAAHSSCLAEGVVVALRVWGGSLVNAVLGFLHVGRVAVSYMQIDVGVCYIVHHVVASINPYREGLALLMPV